MKKISILEFRKNIYKHIYELPVVVTAKGKDIFMVMPSYETSPMEDVLNKVTNKVFKKTIEATETKVRTFNLKNAQRSIICKQHGGQLIGDKYSCCG